MAQPVFLSATLAWLVFLSLYLINRYALSRFFEHLWPERPMTSHLIEILVLIFAELMLLWIYFARKRSRHDKHIAEIMQQRTAAVSSQAQQQQALLRQQVEEADSLVPEIDPQQLIQEAWRSPATLVLIGLYWAALTFGLRLLSALWLEPMLVSKIVHNAYALGTTYGSLSILQQFSLFKGHLWILVLVSQIIFPVLLGKWVLSASMRVQEIEQAPDRSSPDTPMPPREVLQAFQKSKKQH